MLTFHFGQGLFHQCLTEPPQVFPLVNLYFGVWRARPGGERERGRHEAVFYGEAYLLSFGEGGVRLRSPLARESV